MNNVSGSFGSPWLSGNTFGSSQNSPFSTSAAFPGQTSYYLDEIFFSLQAQLAVVNLARQQLQNLQRPPQQHQQDCPCDNDKGTKNSAPHTGTQTQSESPYQRKSRHHQHSHHHHGQHHDHHRGHDHHHGKHHKHQRSHHHHHNQHQVKAESTPCENSNDLQTQLDKHAAEIQQAIGQVSQLKADQFVFDNFMQSYTSFAADFSNSINDYFIMQEVNLNNARILEKHDDYFVVEGADMSRYTILRNI